MSRAGFCSYWHCGQIAVACVEAVTGDADQMQDTETWYCQMHYKAAIAESVKDLVEKHWVHEMVIHYCGSLPLFPREA